MNLFIVLL